VEYSDFSTLDKANVVVDLVGAQVLADCWRVIKPEGTLLLSNACSWAFREEHRNKGIDQGKEGVRALYMIAEPSEESMARISDNVARGNIRSTELTSRKYRCNTHNRLASLLGYLRPANSCYSDGGLCAIHPSTPECV
jgi:hypothetical protein